MFDITFQFGGDDMKEIKHLLFTDRTGEIAIIFPKMKSQQMISGKVTNKNNEMVYELKDVFPVRNPGHFNDYWHIPISHSIMESIGAKHKYDLVCEINK